MGHVTLNLCFCIRYALFVIECIELRPRHTISHALVGPVRIPKKHAETCYAKLVFCIRWARNVDTLFSKLGWDQYGFQKQRVETRYAELVFCIRWDLRVT
jgi:hypothetical protein